MDTTVNETNHRHLLTFAEVAETCSVSISTVRRWASRGSLRVVTLPVRLLRVRAADLEAFIAEHFGVTA